jgi:peptidoglycan/LPS O-acetylase OafA/YrhL
MDRRRFLLTSAAGVLVGPSPLLGAVALSRSPQLDALRAFAVAGVVFHHYIRQPQLGIFAIAGVKLFFVLSGFLITRLLLVARRDVDVGRQRRIGSLAYFYARRVLRIFPLYYLIVAVSVVVDLPPSREILPWLLSYTLNFHMAGLGEYVDHFAHFWTLAVEEQFYVVWPWLMLFAPRAALLPVVLGLIALAPVYRLYGVVTDLNAIALFVSPFASLDSLGMGALLALVAGGECPGTRLTSWCWERLALLACLAGTVVLYLTAFHSPWWRAGFVAFDLVLAVFFARLIGTVTRQRSPGLAGAVLECRPLVYLGKISYGIYVYHVFTPLGVVLLARWIGWNIGGRSWAVLGVAAVATVVVASLSWHIFEHPINKLKRRLEGDER